MSTQHKQTDETSNEAEDVQRTSLLGNVCTLYSVRMRSKR
jgi:hypothetical protein